MGRLSFWTFGSILLLGTACGGDDFGGGGSGTDAGAGTGGTTQDAGTGGSAGSAAGGGQAGADAGAAICRDDLLSKKCDDALVTTGDATCDACGQAACCTQIETCLANPDCAPLLLCYLENCLNQSAVNCISKNCVDCTSAPLVLLPVSSCLQANCGPPNNSQCPMLLQ